MRKRTEIVAELAEMERHVSAIVREIRYHLGTDDRNRLFLLRLERENAEAHISRLYDELEAYDDAHPEPERKVSGPPYIIPTMPGFLADEDGHIWEDLRYLDFDHRGIDE